jgi:hypothetical protein
MTIEEIKACYGFDPRTVGLRHRGYWIVKEVKENEKQASVIVGDLCIAARDGGSNPCDAHAGGKGRYVGNITDDYDCTYRHYYYRPIEKPAMHLHETYDKMLTALLAPGTQHDSTQQSGPLDRHAAKKPIVPPPYPRAHENECWDCNGTGRCNKCDGRGTRRETDIH